MPKLRRINLRKNEIKFIKLDVYRYHTYGLYSDMLPTAYYYFLKHKEW